MPLFAAGIGPGDAVFVPSFTFAATAEVVALAKAEPVFVDVDPETYNIDIASLEAAIAMVKAEGRLKPKAIIPVDLFGLGADYAAIEKIAEREKLMVIEDAAQAIGGSRRRQDVRLVRHGRRDQLLSGKAARLLRRRRRDVHQ